ncbi:4211_t:CDS:1, partial [Paraglomus occultum]
MTQDSWAEFSSSITTYLKENTIIQEIDNISTLNKLWHDLNQAIIIAAKKNIPRTRTQPRTFYTFSTKATKLHAALKCINKLIRQIQANTQSPTNTLIQTYNKEIDYINNKTEIQINHIILDDLTSTNKEALIILLKAQQRTIYQARKLENNLAHQSKINEYINKRYNDLNNNTTHMINSILKRHTDP